LAGGDDVIDGGAGRDLIYGDGSAQGAGGPATVAGGSDLLSGGAGDDTLYGDGVASGYGATVTGDDTLVGGRGADVLWGDGIATSSGASAVTGGMDRFAFGRRDGLDMLMDFRRADGDVIDLSGAGLSWVDLDSDGTGVLDNDDLFVVVDAMDTVIDLGAAAGSGRVGLDTLRVVGVFGLVATDFDFG
jgi:Ca2+-binding RTX toxin-like protein